MESKITVVGAPLYTLSKFYGMRYSPDKLKQLGLFSVLKECFKIVNDSGNAILKGPSRDEGPDKIKNLDTFKNDTILLTEKIESAYDEGMLLLLGGECSLIIGSLNANSKVQKGKPGIVWFDAHGDFNTPEITPSGYIGGMCLAFACGRGKKYMHGILNADPLDEELVVHLGSRALDELEKKEMLSSKLLMLTSNEIKEKGIKQVIREISKRIENADWHILHIDVDVVEPNLLSPIWPAVNYPTSGGLSFDDLTEISRYLLENGLVKIIHITAYNSLLDSTGDSGIRLVELVRELFRR